jgi:XTP/dITP diphosphohydrolase
VEVAKKDKAKMESEFGDVLFALVNYARYLDIDPDKSLELSNQKFIKRFQYIEAQAKAYK